MLMAMVEVDGLTSFWELFCLSKMEGRPPQMRAMSRVLVLGSTILSSVFRESKESTCCLLGGLKWNESFQPLTQGLQIAIVFSI